MPLHYTPEQKWTLFLNTIIKNNQNFEIMVIKVNDKDINFTADVDTIKYLRCLLANPDDLKSQVVHLINQNNKTLDSDTVSTISVQNKVPAYYNYSAIELLEKLFSPEYILSEENNGIGLTGNCLLHNFKYDNITSVATLHLQGTKNYIKRDTAKFEILMSSVPSTQTALDILNGVCSPINQELPEPTDLSSIIKITTNNPRSVDITYNYGLLLQKLQEKDKISTPEHPPMIASLNVNKTEAWTLSKEIVLNYLEPIFNNVVCSTIETESNTLRPIFFLKKVVSEQQTHSLHALFDTSGSMKDGFENYLQQYLMILNKFIDTVKQDWQITVVQFNHEINVRTFNANDHNFNSIKAYVKTFEPEGQTRLHEALYQSLQHYKNSSTQNLLSTLIILTDGEDVPVTRNSPTIEQITDLAQKVGQNHNFALYSMGLGMHYNNGFFTQLAKDGGFTHINLNTTHEMTELIQYMESCSNTRVVVSLLDTNGTEYIERVPQDGTPHIANNTISIGGSIGINGQVYTISDMVSNYDALLIGMVEGSVASVAGDL